MSLQTSYLKLRHGEADQSSVPVRKYHDDWGGEISEDEVIWTSFKFIMKKMP